MNRREFLTTGAVLSGGALILGVPSRVRGAMLAANVGEPMAAPRLLFTTGDAHYQAVYNRALEVLARNVTMLANYPEPVLIEGSTYTGIWLECAPQEALGYAGIRPDVARNNHMAFFAGQKEDGQLPYSLKSTGYGFSQIQMVVPIAATAWELARQTGDCELLERAYESCSRWDAWLRRYRDTRHTGLCEGFCTYDTGHDNSPRWAGIPRQCPDRDARKCPPLPTLPRLCPDLSATVFGGRVALAAMARALGKNADADHWSDDAETIRAAILKRLYSAEDAAFYDLDAQNRFVRIRGDVISRVLGEHVVDPALFDIIYRHQIHNPAAFWAPYPLPSIALNDPTFVRPIPRNSWGGASQALTALRAPRWMEHYRKPADLAHLMEQWISAILRDEKFRQQLDPLTGSFTPAAGDYSPAALVFLDFTWRLAGVRTVGDDLEWNVRPQRNQNSRFRLTLSPTSVAEIRYHSGHAELLLNGKVLCRTASTVRLVSTRSGALDRAVSILPASTSIVLERSGRRQLVFTLAADQQLGIATEAAN